MKRISLCIGVSLLFILGALFAQKRFGNELDGRFRGFTKSPTEHIMIEYEGCLEFRKVRGLVTEASSGVGIPNALFEIRSEDLEENVKGVKTNSNGEFRMRSVDEGVYVFKVTLDGFQSVYGRLKVNKNAPPRNIFRIQLRQGV
jgi:hypothetical protein